MTLTNDSQPQTHFHISQKARSAHHTFSTFHPITSAAHYKLATITVLFHVVKMYKTGSGSSPHIDSSISTMTREVSTTQQKPQDLDRRVTQSKAVTTIAVCEVASSKPILILGPQPSPKLLVFKQQVSELTTWQKWGYSDPQIGRTMAISSTTSEHTTVHKGFGGFMLEKRPVDFEKRVPLYPPLPNAAYNLLNSNLEPHIAPATRDLFDGAAFVKEYILRRNEEEKRPSKPEPASLAEQAADKIDWTRRLYTGEEMCPQGIPGFCVGFWRNDLVTAINDAIRLGDEPFEMCNKCHKRHIGWGPSIALHDRDTCLSKLPTWFPAEEFEEPWNSFGQIINKLVSFEEIQQGRRLDPNRTAWDKSFHEESDEWTALGRIKGGWWKCRTSNGEDTEVPMLERQCKLCHRTKTKETEALESRSKKIAAEKIRIHDWIERCMKIEMLKDKAIVESWKRRGLD